MAIVPPAAKIVHALKLRITAPEWAQAAAASIELPFSWTCLFWAATSFTVGNLVYQIFCPRIVKEHTDFGDFQRSGKGLWQLCDYAEDFAGAQQRVVSSMPSASAYESRRIGEGSLFVAYDMAWGPTLLKGIFHVDNEADLGQEIEMGHAMGDQDAFWCIHRAAIRHRPRAVATAALAFTVGFLLIGYVFLQNVGWVLGVAFP
jgi:hypothetical protein